MKVKLTIKVNAPTEKKSSMCSAGKNTNEGQREVENLLYII